MRKIYITGISGTGKTTLSEELEKRGFYVISIDETPGLCYWASKESGEKVKEGVELNSEFIASHDWICDIEQLKELTDKDVDAVFVLGSASNQDDYLNIFDKVFLLRTSPEVFIERLNNRDNNPFGKEDSAQKSILSWYEDFESKMLEKGAIPVNAENPIEKVADEILSGIR